MYSSSSAALNLTDGTMVVFNLYLLFSLGLNLYTSSEAVAKSALPAANCANKSPSKLT